MILDGFYDKMPVSDSKLTEGIKWLQKGTDMVFIANCYSKSWSFIKSVPFDGVSRDDFPAELAVFNLVITDENGGQV